MVKLWNLPVLILAALASSCSMIGEDRDECPCWYTIDLTEVDGRVENLRLWLFDHRGNTLESMELDAPPYGKYEVKVERGRVFCSVWGNISEKSRLHDDGTVGSYYSKADSCSSDPLFNYMAVVDADSDLVCDTVRLRKEYAVVNFTLKGTIGSDGPYELETVMSTVGRYLDGGYIRGLSNTYSYSEEIEEGVYKFGFDMMRQENMDELKLRIFSLAGGKKMVVKEFPLGKWLLMSGYDATALDMADISVVLDLAVGQLSVRTEDWQSALHVGIEI